MDTYDKFDKFDKCDKCDKYERHQILVVFDHKPHILYIPVKSELTLLEIIQSIIPIPRYNELLSQLDTYYFLVNGSISSPEAIIPQDYKTYYLTCYKRQNGGGDFTDIFGFIVKPIFAPIDAIVAIFILTIKFIIWAIKFIVWTVFFLGWLIIDFLNPINFASDFFNTLVVIIFSICKLVFDTLIGLAAFTFNSLSSWMQGFWGWDNQFTTTLDKNSEYLKRINKNKNRKCYLTNTNSVPFSVLLGTILCPPVGVFMDMGMTGWMNILICIMLTLLFYLPGLAYALLIIYG